MVGRPSGENGVTFSSRRGRDDAALGEDDAPHGAPCRRGRGTPRPRCGGDDGAVPVSAPYSSRSRASAVLTADTP